MRLKELTSVIESSLELVEAFQLDLSADEIEELGKCGTAELVVIHFLLGGLASLAVHNAYFVRIRLLKE